MAIIYETRVDRNASDSSNTFILDMVGYNKRVLEVGCATGYITKVLSERGCTVVGIDLDPDAAAKASSWAENVVVGDLDAGTLWQELEGEQFDVITFGHVLEQLRNPLATLRSAIRLLNPSGFVAISVPNIAHGDVRMALLRGAFPHSTVGLQDRSHIRFFTKSILLELIKEAGLLLVDTRRVSVPLFQTDLNILRSSIDHATVSVILEDPEAETYQFVMKAVVDNGTHELSTLADRLNDLSDHMHDEVVRTALPHNEMDLLRSEGEESRRLLDEARMQRDSYRRQLYAILDTKSFRMLKPWRKIYGYVRRHTEASPGSP